MFFCSSPLPVKKQQQRRRKNKGEKRTVYLDLMKQTEIEQGSSLEQGSILFLLVSSCVFYLGPNNFWTLLCASKSI